MSVTGHPGAAEADGRQGDAVSLRARRRSAARRRMQWRSWPIAALALALLARAASAEEVEAFYAAHPLTITVASEADGAYAAYTRTLAAYMVRYLPGHPAIRLRFMGANGGLAAAHFIADTAPRDGSEMA